MSPTSYQTALSRDIINIDMRIIGCTLAGTIDIPLPLRSLDVVAGIILVALFRVLLMFFCFDAYSTLQQNLIGCTLAGTIDIPLPLRSLDVVAGIILVAGGGFEPPTSGL